MGWTGVTINTAVFTAAIGIDAGVETNVGAVVISDDGTRGVAEKLGRRSRPFLGVFRIGLMVKPVETVGRICRRAATVDWRVGFLHGCAFEKALGWHW